MKKRIWLKWLLAVILTCSILAGTILLIIPQKKIYGWLYEQQKIEQVSGLSNFEAELNYDGLIQQVIGNQKIQGLSTYTSSLQLQHIVERLQQVYDICRWVAGIGTGIVVIGLLLLRKQKWYECLKLGGIFTLISAGVLVLISYVLTPLRSFFWESQYEVIFTEDKLLNTILPLHWAFYTELLAVLVLCIAGAVLLIWYGSSRQSHRPHKF